MEKVYIEIIALGVGVLVIVIESVIIYMLRTHVKELHSHMDHLDKHSHKVEDMLNKICVELEEDNEI